AFHVDSTTCADCVVEAPGVQAGSSIRQNTRDSERALAQATGGQAFYGSNDVRPALQHVADDSRSADTLGFYPDHSQWNNKFRRLTVKINRPGLKLRYREGYYATVGTGSSHTQAEAALFRAANSPVNATGIEFSLTASRTEPVSANGMKWTV